MSLDPASQSLSETRRSLHGVAELVLAGPQHTTSSTVRLRVVPSGFATTRVPDVRLLDGVVHHGELAVPVRGHTPDEIRTRLELPRGDLTTVYHDGSGVDAGERLWVDDQALTTLTDAWSAGDAALRRIGADVEPVLWPEHFDVGITLDEVNYGVSPGDAMIPVPYAYIGPWTRPSADDFWTEPFGAARPVADLGDADGIAAFFAEGRRRLDRR